jgi:hypothetical protein
MPKIHLLQINRQLAVAACRIRQQMSNAGESALDVTVSLRSPARRKIARFMSNFAVTRFERDRRSFSSPERGSPIVSVVYLVSSIHSEAT